jgi:eukaryotic-like serine/threonine-protein kinase
MPGNGMAVIWPRQVGQVAEPLSEDDPREVAGYQLRARLGAGGMGRVYLAFTPGGRQVALKMMRPEYGDNEEFRARFRQEVGAAKRVHGLFTAQVLDADPDAPQPWLATSYVPGPSLRQAVSEYGPLPLDTLLLLIAGIAEALQAIHAVGIVHRDLKPANVILAADGPRVIDFGIARASAAPALTLRGSWVGTPRFMAPEQARGEDTTTAVDVFALGSLATYASTGHPPFGTDSPLAVLYRVLNDDPDLRGCPPDLRPLIEHCLAKDPDQRPAPSDIIEHCREAAGGLAFDRSWLPAPLSAAAAAADGSSSGLAAGSSPHRAGAPDATMSSQGDQATPAGPGPPPAAAPPGGGLGRFRRHPASADPSPSALASRKAMAGVAGAVAVVAVAVAGVSLLSTPTTDGGPGTGQRGSPTARPNRASFTGSWHGTISEPGWSVSRWPIKLIIPKAGAMGSYQAPSLGCAGDFPVPPPTDSRIKSEATTTTALSTGCTGRARLILSLNGGQLALVWIPDSDPQEVGRATLSSN